MKTAMVQGREVSSHPRSEACLSRDLCYMVGRGIHDWRGAQTSTSLEEQWTFRNTLETESQTLIFLLTLKP